MFTIQTLIDAIEYEINLTNKAARRLRTLQAKVREAATRKKAAKRNPKCPDSKATT